MAASHSSPYPDTTLMRVTVESLQYESGFLGGISEKTPLPAADRGANGAPSPMEYLTNILSSKAYDVAIESPLQFAPKLSQRLGVNLWLKREDLQPVIYPLCCFLIIPFPLRSKFRVIFSVNRALILLLSCIRKLE